MAACGGVGPAGPFGFSWLIGLSAWKTPILSLGFVWISLDSLVRKETYQWVTRKNRGKNFLVASPPNGRSVETDATMLICGK
jgi:hypothetical protein